MTNEDKFINVEKLMKSKIISFTVACVELGIEPKIFYHANFTERRKELMFFHRSRISKKANRVKKVNPEYIIPQKSPYRKEYRPILRENNYLV